ncbi:MAG: sel1 repeat family protein [Gammaproteobacteria bacterium]|nr:sel1 repeat family protein [Gammaproteobacteria bacterium]
MSRISVVELLFLSFVFLAIYSNSSMASGKPQLPSEVTRCDALAAHPADPEKLSAGVNWDQLDVSAAMKNCGREINRQPDNARIQFQYARVLDKQKQSSDAVFWYRKAAEQGYVAAQNSLGYAYEWGQGIEADYYQAEEWYRKAAEQGYAQAQNNLATMYYLGKGAGHDEKEALYWYQKAAGQGHATAQRNLGVMYSKGSVVQQNYETAFNWYLKAASQDNAHAQYNVGMSYFYGKGVESSQEKARIWFEKAAQNGNYQAVEALHQIQFKASYCNSLFNTPGENSDAGIFANQKLMSNKLCP